MKAALLLMFVVGCASAHQSAEPMVSMSPNPHAEIEQRMRAITDAMGTAGIQASCLGAACEALPADALTAPKTDNACHPGPSDTCTQACTLGDSICDNAQHVCTLADGLPGDAWATEKCADAKQSCHAAHDRCCSCA